MRSSYKHIAEYGSCARAMKVGRPHIHLFQVGVAVKVGEMRWEHDFVALGWFHGSGLLLFAMGGWWVSSQVPGRMIFSMCCAFSGR